ncbi:MAG: hypothetical protein GY865_19180, partial [candidate division Zixibacteria bacterium]|nr:hypothetical protein [candidate division Zixibacteria bacterium]
FKLAQLLTYFYGTSNTKPSILHILPEKNLDRYTIRYFNLPRSLNYHYFVSDENILDLSKNTDAVLARYGETYCYLLCIKYPKETDAKKAYKIFQKAYLPEGDKLDIYSFEENKWFTSELLREYILIVFDAPTKIFANELKGKVLEKIILQ